MLRIKCENGVTLKFWVGSIKIVPDLDTSYLTNRLYPFHIESQNEEFKLNPLTNGVDMGPYVATIVVWFF